MVVAVAVPLGEAVGVAGRVLVGVPPGESVGGVAEGEDPLQAEIDAEASTVMAAQPIAVNLALSLVPAMVARISMGPPRRPAGGRSLVPASETGLGTEIAVLDPSAGQAGRRHVPESAAGHKGKARRRPGHAMAHSSLGY